MQHLWMNGAWIVNKPLPELEIPSLTKDRLTLSAITLFSQKWYGTVSVAEICRSAGFSNGLFYRYFQDKEAIFRHILELVIQKISAEIADLPGKTTDDRLALFVQRIFDFSLKNPAIVKVFREGQYRFFEYEKRLKGVYEDALVQIFGKQPNLSTYLFALGGLRFAATRSVFHGIPTDVSSLLTILRHGLFANFDVRPAKVFSTSIIPLPLEIMPAPRERILREGKILLGKQGYYDTNIHEITSAASLSTGAFYTYFENKEAFFAELIHRVGREVRRFISLNLEDALNPLERELRGLWLFIVFLSLDRNCYGIVREAEFVLPAEVKQYYGAFVKGYRQRLQGIDLADSTTAIEFMLGIAHYLGIEVVFDHSPENAKNVISEIGEFYRHGFGSFLV